MAAIDRLYDQLKERFSTELNASSVAFKQITLEVKSEHLLEVARSLRDETAFAFNVLLDVCGVDYLHYGLDDWETDASTATGFSRGVTDTWERAAPAAPTRFAVVYHLLSITNNQRVRLRVDIPDKGQLIVDSVMPIWPSANWYEREAFDLYGILFRGHPDLRRILTDYGFSGHPFRKDFPLIGKVEVRYDATLKRVIYEPVSIEPRILEPKVIRHDHRYIVPEEGKHDGKN